MKEKDIDDWSNYPVRTEIEVLTADPYEYCPLCSTDVVNLQWHCDQIGDDAHSILFIHRV
jgi:hypothetical protein